MLEHVVDEYFPSLAGVTLGDWIPRSLKRWCLKSADLNVLSR
jgi:hypothetical protein